MAYDLYLERLHELVKDFDDPRGSEPPAGPMDAVKNLLACEWRLRKALDDLFSAALPYLDKAAPHEELFNGEDLRNFERLSAATLRAAKALAPPYKPAAHENAQAHYGRMLAEQHMDAATGEGRR